MSTIRYRTPRSNKNNAADSPVGGACQGSSNHVRANSCQKNLTGMRYSIEAARRLPAQNAYFNLLRPCVNFDDFKGSSLANGKFDRQKSHGVALYVRFIP